MTLNETHDPSRRSWVTGAQGSQFPIQNLPFGVVRRCASREHFRVAVAIGDYALDLSALKKSGLFECAGLDACQSDRLNDFMALSHEEWSTLRRHLSEILTEGYAKRSAVEALLIPLDQVEYALPATIGDYTDFYASIHHATNIGRLFRPDNPLLPNYEWVPIGYHGRSSSIGVSGQRFPRPIGQLKAPDAQQPTVAPCQRLDYELEVGIFSGTANQLGHAITIGDAESHIFGLCLMNDWSARDIQAWEYQPLGPFLAKNFATTISPWIVTMDALAPFRAPFERIAPHPAPLPYLDSSANSTSGAIDLELSVWLQTERMREAGLPAERLSTSNFKDAYWTAAQLLTHHTVNGCNLQPGDLLGSGTMSGKKEGSQGALIEITEGGKHPIALANGERRAFLEDGDTVILRGHCERDGAVSIGFGEVVGTVLPAVHHH